MASGGDQRLRIVILDRPGPTTRPIVSTAYMRAMEQDERRSDSEFGFVVLHDAEDMVDPAALNIFDLAMEHAEFVQLPVLPEPHVKSRWIASHYCEEFAEAHGKAMVVRDALSAGLPAAGVGCAFERGMLARLAAEHPVNGGPFSPESLTEDYELGLRIKALGGDSAFVRVRDEAGRLVATRAFFPDGLRSAVRQKTRWIHGIAFQSWERLGWSFRPIEFWMRARDRRGPITAICARLRLFVAGDRGDFGCAELAGYERPWKPDPLLQALIAANLASFALRIAMRFAFTTREYGVREGLRAVLRIPVANVIAIMAGRRAFTAYLLTPAARCPNGTRRSMGRTRRSRRLRPAADEATRGSSRATGPCPAGPAGGLGRIAGCAVGIPLHGRGTRNARALAGERLPRSFNSSRKRRLRQHRPKRVSPMRTVCPPPWKPPAIWIEPAPVSPASIDLPDPLRPQLVPFAPSAPLPPRLVAAHNMLFAAGLSNVPLAA